jgi:hypothetical protein
MKLLLDSCVSPSLIAQIAERGHEALWVISANLLSHLPSHIAASFAS